MNITDNNVKNSTTQKQVVCVGGSCSIVSYDKEAMTATFYAAIWSPSIDSWGRAYDIKSFNRTIKNSNYRVPFLMEHKNDKVIGFTKSMKADSKGLKVVAEIYPTSFGKDYVLTYDDYKYSFRGYIYESDVRTIGGKQVEYVTEFRLEEVTATLFPANIEATSIKLNSVKKPTDTAKSDDKPTTKTPPALDKDHSGPVSVKTPSKEEAKDVSEGYGDVIDLIKSF